MSEEYAESQVSVIRSAIIEFLETMKQEKRALEQQIRERTENIRSQFLSSGSSQFSFTDIDDFSRQYKDEFLSFYRNNIHLKIVTFATGKIRHAIESALLDTGVIQEEWLNIFKTMEEQINQFDQMDGKIEEYEATITEQADMLDRMSDGATVHSDDFEKLQEEIDKSNQLLLEKDQEILNLTEGITRMENQTGALGQQMLENSMTIEDLQATIGEKDEEVSGLRSNLREVNETVSEIEILKEQLKQGQLRERELETQAGSASGELVDQLQKNLEKTRASVLELRRDIVSKNEDIHQLKLEKDEVGVKSKNRDDKMQAMTSELTTLKEDKINFEKNNEENLKLKEELKKKLGASKTKLDNALERLKASDASLLDVNAQLEKYEGKEAISSEEQTKINKELSDLKYQIKQTEDAINYFKNLIANDSKYKTLLYMDSIKKEIRIDDLANGVGLPVVILRNILIELSDAGLCNTRRDGRFIFVQSLISNKTPFTLETITN